MTPRKTVNVEMPAELHTEMAKAAKSLDLPVSAVIRLACFDWLQLRAAQAAAATT